MSNDTPTGFTTGEEDGSFTLDGYRDLLMRTADQYEFGGFELLDSPDLDVRKVCIVRHDIDISPSRALSMARIEAELGVSATYTVLMTGRFYNPFEQHVRDILLEIVSLGHSIGLHFDAEWHRVSDEDELSAAVSWEARTLGNILKGVPIGMFSFHDPSQIALTFQASSYSGLWNAYSKVQRRNFSYLSDSNGYWRFRSWSEALEQNPERLHILIHPEWWMQRYSSPAQRISAAIDDRSLSMWQSYCAALAAGHRENLSPVPEAMVSLPKALGNRGDQIIQQWLSGQCAGALLNLLVEVRRRGAAAVRDSPPSREENAAVELINLLAEGGAEADEEEMRTAFSDLALLFASSQQ